MINASSRTRNCVAMTHTVYIMVNAKTSVCTIATVCACLLSGYCVDMCPHSNFCMDVFCWFLDARSHKYRGWLGTDVRSTTVVDGLSCFQIRHIYLSLSPVTYKHWSHLNSTFELSWVELSWVESSLFMWLGLKFPVFIPPTCKVWYTSFYNDWTTFHALPFCQEIVWPLEAELQLFCDFTLR